jgi:hypothetical protein
MQITNKSASKTFDALTRGMNHVGDHKKIENSPFMPLYIEVVDRQGSNSLRISICHYGSQNGDLMHDPEICFIRVPGIDGKGMYSPYYYRNDYLGIEQFPVEFDDNGAVKSFKPKMQKDIIAFANQWAKNLREQGFI